MVVFNKKVAKGNHERDAKWICPEMKLQKWPYLAKKTVRETTKKLTFLNSCRYIEGSRNQMGFVRAALRFNEDSHLLLFQARTGPSDKVNLGTRS